MVISRLTLSSKKGLLALSLFVLLELASLAGLFERFEMDIYDAWFRLRGVHSPGDQVVVIAMDEASIEKLGPVPWPRSIHSELLEKLNQARVVAFDLIFDVPTTPVEDQALAAAATEHGRVVLAAKFNFERDANGEMVQVFTQPQPGAVEIMSGAKEVGFINMPTDDDGVIRSATLVDTNTLGFPVPSFDTAVVLAAGDLDLTKMKLEPGQLIIDNQKIPLDNLNRARPSFWGPQGTFKTYSYTDVISGNIPPSVFKDKIVLIGATAVILKDNYPTPFTTSNLVLSGSSQIPGVEIHASVIQSFIDGSWYRKAAPVLNLAFLFLITIIITIVVSGRGPWFGLAGMLTVLACTAGFCFGLWWLAKLWLNLAAPLVLIFLNYAVMTAADFIQAEMGRRRTREMFHRYVSPPIVEQLMQNPENVRLGGYRQMLTIMFCDIRGFTGYSENKNPEEVVERLNQYLSAMTKVIFRYGGTLDKYLGDGLMAIFGAPVYYPDHVPRAIRAAVEIQAAVDELNRRRETEKEMPLQVGIGINSGEVLVGNVGSSERMDYTVIGEDVNLAARMEGLTKIFHNLIIISERSVRLLADTDHLPGKLLYLGQTEIKGFTIPVGVYTVNVFEQGEII